jgi:hypothetical protein
VANVKVDFSGVDQEIRRGGGTYVPPGDYGAKIVKGELKDSERSGSRYFAWQLQITRPAEFKGKTVYTNTSLKPEALWSLRNLIHAATGKNVAGRALNFDPEKLYGKEIAVTTEDREYEGKMRTNVVDVRPISELEDEEETEEETETTAAATESDDEELEEVDVDDL